MTDLFVKILRFFPFSVHEMIVRLLDAADNICDLGCGDGGLFSHIGARVKIGFAVGVDVFLPYLRVCKKRKVYEDLIQCDIRFLPFREKVFDVVLAVHVIEHLPKGHGILEHIEKIGRKLVIVITPSIFTPQQAFDGNIFQKHLSVYSPAEFITRGYKIKGMGCKIVCGEHYKKGKIPVPFRYVVSLASLLITPLTLFLPSIADHILALKYLSEDS